MFAVSVVFLSGQRPLSDGGHLVGIEQQEGAANQREKVQAKRPVLSLAAHLERIQPKRSGTQL